MLKVVVQPSTSGELMVHTTLGNKEVVISGAEAIRRTNKLEGIYDKINEYFSTIPKKDQEKYFKAAVEAERISREHLELSKFEEETMILLQEAAEAVDYNRWLNWFSNNYGDIHIPEQIKDCYEPDADGETTAAKTYIKSEFIDFLGLVLYFRMMVPIYGEFRNYIHTTVTHPNLKIYTLLKEIADKDLDKLPDEDQYENLSPAKYHFVLSNLRMDQGPQSRLRVYVETNYITIHNHRNQEHVVLGAGLSDDSIEDFLIAEAVVNKLLAMDFYVYKNNPISYVYQTVNFDGNFISVSDGQLRTKKKNSTTSDEDYSHIENYRLTSDLSPGEVTEIQFALSNDEVILRGLGFDVDEFDWEMYEEELKNVDEISSRPIEPVTYYLLGWFLSGHVNPRSLDYIDRVRVSELLMLAKTCLMSEEQEYIGVFLGSIRDKNVEYLDPTVTVKGVLGKQLSQELQSMMSFGIVDRVLTYEIPIIEFSKQIANLQWRPLGKTLPEFVSKEGILLTPTDINAVIVDYVDYVIEVKRRSVAIAKAFEDQVARGEIGEKQQSTGSVVLDALKGIR